MGTNYYIRRDACPHCGRGDDDFHIGKSSGGWHFSLHVYPEQGINTLDDWKPLLKEGPIYDEYGTLTTYDEMLDVICNREGAGTSRLSAQFFEDNYAEPGKAGLLAHKITDGHCIGHSEGTWDYIISDFC